MQAHAIPRLLLASRSSWLETARLSVLRFKIYTRYPRRPASTKLTGLRFSIYSFLRDTSTVQIKLLYLYTIIDVGCWSLIDSTIKTVYAVKTTLNIACIALYGVVV